MTFIFSKITKILQSHLFLTVLKLSKQYEECLYSLNIQLITCFNFIVAYSLLLNTIL